MSEEGLTKTPNDLIHIGKPIEFDENIFLGSLGDLMEVAYHNTEAVKLMVEQLVDTYHPSEPLSDEQRKQYAKEIQRILNVKSWQKKIRKVS